MEERRYPFAERDAHWQAEWERAGAFRASDDPQDPRPRSYVLDMFPYPSGEGLHVGHPKGFIATDVTCRFLRMRGRNVLHPFGWDAFGLPAEQYALATGTHPREAVAKNVERFKRQVGILGLGFDWNREINTTDPAYFKWTQWIFLQLLERGLAYEAEVPVNWCPALGTVLANEEVVGGVSERGGHPVERRPLRQWMLRITAYADRLLDDLEGLDWPEPIKEMQRHWIGRSEGATIKFPALDAAGEPLGEVMEAFTTRPDTLGGATYAVLAPEHPLVDALTEPTRREEVDAYRAQAAKLSDLERTGTAGEKTGVDTGGTVRNPLTGEAIPVWIGDYVLGHYGTGAIMCVPAHDERDHEFARRHGLPIRPVVSAPEGHDYDAAAWEGEGLSDTPAAQGLPTAKAIPAMTAWLAAEGHGEATISYRLRDWLFSRQRYWGEPIPVVHGPEGITPLAAADLPLTLPDLERIEPTGDGRSPLALAKEWVETEQGTRETNTMPQWAGSCWYYLRYIDPHNEAALVAPDKERLWMPVDLYVGGAEHAVLHLLYARFWHKVLYDLGVVHTKEPFARLQNVGHVQGADGQKMSKSRGNVVNPDDVVAEVGADVFRLFEMFMGPFAGSAPWSPDDIQGVRRFLDRAWRLLLGPVAAGDPNERLRHATVIKVTEDIGSFDFNTAISALMIYQNELEANGLSAADRDTHLRLLTPFAPHFAEEVHLRLEGEGLAASLSWPEGDSAKAAAEMVEIPVTVAGKLRARLQVPVGTSQEELERLALAEEGVAKRLSGAPRRVVVVADRLVNIVP